MYIKATGLFGTKLPMPKVAREDIKVYKVLNVTQKNNVCIREKFAPCGSINPFGTQVIWSLRDDTYHDTISVYPRIQHVFYKNLYKVITGIETYRYLNDLIDKYAGLPNYIIVTAVIPKGTEYYVSDDGKKLICNVLKLNRNILWDSQKSFKTS